MHVVLCVCVCVCDGAALDHDGPSVAKHDALK